MEIKNLNMYQRLRDFNIPTIVLDEIFSNDDDLKTLEKSWKDVQNNLGKFQNLFGGNFRIVDNTVYKPIGKQVQKAVNAFVRKKVYNPIGKKWIQTARALKNKNFIK